MDGDKNMDGVLENKKENFTRCPGTIYTIVAKQRDTLLS